MSVKAARLQITALTPLQRLAYNIPLILVRSKNVATACYQLLREVWRIVYIPLIVLTVTGLASYLVANVSTLLKDFIKTFRGVVSGGAASTQPQFNHSLSDIHDVVTILVFLGIVLALASLLLSIPAQIRDMFRVRNVLHSHKPNPFTGFTSAFAGTTGDWVDRIRKAWVQTTYKEKLWSIEIRARRWLSVLTITATVFLTWTTASVISGRESQFLLTRPLTSVIHDFILALLPHQQLQKLAVTAGLLALAILLKRVFVDYVGDIALYATADENSAFFRTRIEILTHATRKIRWVLRGYNEISVAGHSLGSVIMYDAVSWLRVESQVPFKHGSLTAGTRATEPVSAAEFARLRALITFGSPLDKIVYFFRTKIQAYETIRAHILKELYGFRMADALTASDPRIGDDPPFRPPSALRWLNVYSSMDPISGRLAYFEGVDNYWRWYWLWGLAHLSYWHDNKFYRRVYQTIV